MYGSWFFFNREFPGTQFLFRGAIAAWFQGQYGAPMQARTRRRKPDWGTREESTERTARDAFAARAGMEG